MKKVLFVLAGLLLCNTLVYSQLKYSIGGGMLFYGDFRSYKSQLFDNYVFNNTGGATEFSDTSCKDYLGGFVYFDLTYAEIFFGIANSPIGGSETNIQFGAYAKYPFEIQNISIFPLLGVEYFMVIAKEDIFGRDFGTQYYSSYFYSNGVETSEKMQMSDLNKLWFTAGLGMDINFQGGFYLRFEYLFSIATLSNADQNTYDEYYSDTSPQQYAFVINYRQMLKAAAGFTF
jgi:hypothetical protein